MQYLWINPVSAGMCEEDSLKRFLERHGLTRVECRGDWGRIVRERYEASLRAGVTLADARCPEAVRLLEEIQKESENESGIENLKVAPIEPILLHCARELSTRPGDRRQPDSAGVFCGNLPERWTGGEGRECQQSGENPGICGERKLEAGGSAGTFVL